MNRTLRNILKELIITMCAGDALVLERVRLQRVVLRAQKYVASLPAFYFFLFQVSLILLNYALPPLSWKLRPFTWMSLEDRLKYLEEWQGSRFYFKRVLMKMLTAVCISHLYSEKELLSSLGYSQSMAHRSAGQ